jgi:dTDP-4-dehydrorhamnose 3,5-epimerase
MIRFSQLVLPSQDPIPTDTTNPNFSYDKGGNIVGEGGYLSESKIREIQNNIQSDLQKLDPIIRQNFQSEYNLIKNNQSTNINQNILRGLHYQHQHPQAKLVRCTQGAIFDVAIDLRKSSPTFSKWVGVELSEENRRQLWIPEGFAHGYLTLTTRAVCQYQATDFWAKGDEYCLNWDDPTVNIQWPTINNLILSDKDKQGKPLSEIPLF